MILPNKNEKSSISSLIVDKKELTSDKDITNAMNVYFTSIATTLLTNRTHNFVSETAPKPVSPYIRNFNFSLHNGHEVFRALKEVDPDPKPQDVTEFPQRHLN